MMSVVIFYIFLFANKSNEMTELILVVSIACVDKALYISFLCAMDLIYICSRNEWDFG